MIFPIQIRPKNDELLSSWLVRLAHENCVSITSLLDSIGLAKYAQEDFDLIESSEFFKALTKAARISKQDLVQCQIRDWAKLTGSASQCTRKWIVPVCHRHPKLRYCPECLKENFFFRKEWRITWLGACPKHHVVLEEGCCNCGEGLQPGRVAWRESLSSCWSCRLPFSRESGRPLKHTEYFKIVERAMSKLAVGVTSRSAEQWFDIVWTLANWIGKVHREGELLPIDGELGGGLFGEECPEADAFYRAVLIWERGADFVGRQIACHQFEFDRITYKKCPEGLKRFRRDHDWRLPRVEDIQKAIERLRMQGKVITFYGIAREIGSTYETLRKYKEFNDLITQAMSDECRGMLKIKGVRKKR